MHEISPDGCACHAAPKWTGRVTNDAFFNLQYRIKRTPTPPHTRQVYAKWPPQPALQIKPAPGCDQRDAEPDHRHQRRLYVAAYVERDLRERHVRRQRSLHHENIRTRIVDLQ